MNKADISTLIHFNFWADERILTTCENISTADFTAPLSPDPGWGSLRAILVHTLDTQYGWRCILQDEEEEGILNPDDFADVAALTARWQREQAAWLAFLEELDDAKLNAGYGDTPATSPKVWHTILHVVTHGVQHRSEAAASLTGMGHSPGELDFAVFMRAEPESG